MEFTIIIVSALYIIAMGYAASVYIDKHNSDCNTIERMILLFFYTIINCVIGIFVCFIKGYKQMIK